MKNFKEWLSDYLRYFMLLLAMVLLGGIIYIGVRVYQNYDSPTAGEVIEILTEEGQLTERESESETVEETEAASESETETEPQTGTESETEAETESEKKNAGETAVNSASTDAQEEGSTSSAAQTDSEAAVQVQSETQAIQIQSETQAVQIQTETQAVQIQTETQAATEAEPVYRTMTGACNFRSGPGYEYEVMAVYPAGTVVEFLGIVEGWCEVRIDGVIGYMGQRFFE